MLLNNQWINDQKKKKNRDQVIYGEKCKQLNTPKPVGCSKGSSKRKYTAIQANLKKEAKSQMNSRNSQLMKLEK